MHPIAPRHVLQERTLDYLFQESVEEQFEALQTIQDKPGKRFKFGALFSQWFKNSDN